MKKLVLLLGVVSFFYIAPADAGRMTTLLVNSGESCVRILGRALGGRDHKRLAAKAEQNEMKRTPEGNPDDYMGLILARYSEEDLSNFSRLYQKFFQFKRRKLSEYIDKNDNPFNLPAHYLFLEDRDVRGTLRALMTGNPGEEEYEKAKGFVKEWMNRYEAYLDRLRDKVNEGFTALLQLEELKDDIEGPNALSYHDFFETEIVDGKERVKESNGKKVRKTVKRRLSVWKREGDGENGKAIKRQRTFSFPTPENFYNRVDELKRTIKFVFTHSVHEEITRSSEIFGELFEQAQLFKIMTFLSRQLEQEGRYHVDQKPELLKLKKKVHRLLARSELLPRQDAETQLLNEELADEMSYRFSGSKKSEDKARQGAKFDIGVDVKKLANQSFFRYMKIYVFTALTASATSLIWWNFAEKGVGGQTLAYAESNLAKGTRYLLEATGSERSCTAEARDFSFGICAVGGSAVILKPEVIEARGMGPEYRFDEDPEVVQDLTDYHLQMWQMRHQARNANFFTASSSILYGESLELFLAELAGKVVASYKDYDPEIPKALIDIFRDENALGKAIMIDVFKQQTGIDLTKIVALLEEKMPEMQAEAKNTVDLPEAVVAAIKADLEAQGFRQMVPPVE